MRVFDDNAFVKSVSDQFARKGALSDRQRAAMKKLMLRYKAQISNIEQRMAALGMKAPPEKAADAAEATDAEV